MKLLIDAGNSRIKWALTDGQEWLHSGALPVKKAAELALQFSAFEGIRQVWVSNVAGDAIAQQIRAAHTQPAIFIVAQEAQCGVRNTYTKPSQLGSDRWAALIAAWHLVRGACLVVNCGTATTVDALSEKGEFIGGLILPGIELMQHSLRKSTARLQGKSTGKVAAFPLNTADAIHSGALQASCGAIERQYTLFNAACFEITMSNDGGSEPVRRNRAPVILSGGAAEVLRNHLNVPSRLVDKLVLLGLWVISQEMSR